MPAAYSSRAPLTPGRFSFLPVGAVRARGELRQKLQLLKDNLLQKTDLISPESGMKSAWFGGPLNADLAAPNVLEAKLLISTLLPDPALRREALEQLSIVCQMQNEDGRLGPSSASFSARGRMLRAMMAGYSITGDKEILRTILRYFKFLRDSLQQTPLSSEDSMHVSDTIEAGIFFYKITGQKAILPILDRILSQSFPYTKLFHTFPYRLSLYRMITPDDFVNGLAGEAEDGYYHQVLRSADGANLCEGLRSSGLSGMITGSGKDISAPETGLARMNKAHGTAVGAIAANPLLCGTHPSSGISSKAVAELLTSFETLMTCPSPFSVGDQWESCFYNAALAAFSPDFTEVYAVQQANQITPNQSHESGPLSGQTDTTSMLPVIPRFIHSQWMLSSDGGIAAMGYAPCRVEAHFEGVLVRLDVHGNYPSDGKIEIHLSMNRPCVFPVHLRIPSWSREASTVVCGETYLASDGSEFLTISREWHDGDVITLSLPMRVSYETGYHQAVSVVRGPLRFVYVPTISIPGEPDAGKNRIIKAGIALSSASEPQVTSEKGAVLLRAKVYPVPEWKIVDGILEQPPIDISRSETASAEDAVLLRYADAPVRIAVFPVC